MNRKIITALLLLSTSTACSMFQREPGPGERIGRAIDDIRKGIGEIAPEETPEERRAREDREWQRRQDEYYRRRDNSERYRRRDDSDFDLYSDSKRREQEERDREYWDNPMPNYDDKEKDRY